MFNLIIKNSKTSLLIAVSLVISACGGGGGGAGGGSTTVAPRTAETVVFVGNDGASITGQNELYVVKDDASVQKLISKSSVASDSDIKSFAISPDKTWVAYIADHDGLGEYALYTVAMTGGLVTRVSRDTGIRVRTVKRFMWSPDSQQLVFEANFDGASDLNQSYKANEIYVVNRDGSGHTKINGSIGLPASVEARNPQWSPDGRYIVQEVATFSGGKAGIFAFALNIYDTQAGSSNSRRLVTTSSSKSIKKVQWSPDSKRIAFNSDYSVQDVYQLVVIGVNGTPFKQVTSHGDFNSDLQWKPNGAELAYLDHPSTPTPADLVVSAGDGSILKRFIAFVSDKNRSVKDFRWSPDGSQLAYTADQDTANKYELYVAPSSGTGTSTKVSGGLITNGDVFKFEWSPNGNQLAYVADQESDTVIELFVSNVSGTSNVKVSSGLSSSEVRTFAWSLDGQRVAFSEGSTSSRSRADQLYTNSTNGNALVQISDVTVDNITQFNY